MPVDAETDRWAGPVNRSGPVYETSTRPGYDWRDDAACLAYDPETWFPVGSTGKAVQLQIGKAIWICGGCPVIGDCAEFAETTNQVEGIWGGLTEDERRSMKRSAARARKTEAAREEAARVLAAEELHRSLSRTIHRYQDQGAN